MSFFFKWRSEKVWVKRQDPSPSETPLSRYLPAPVNLDRPSAWGGKKCLFLLFSLWALSLGKETTSGAIKGTGWGGGEAKTKGTYRQPGLRRTSSQPLTPVGRFASGCRIKSRLTCRSHLQTHRGWKRVSAKCCRHRFWPLGDFDSRAREVHTSRESFISQCVREVDMEYWFTIDHIFIHSLMSNSILWKMKYVSQSIFGSGIP